MSDCIWKVKADFIRFSKSQQTLPPRGWMPAPAAWEKSARQDTEPVEQNGIKLSFASGSIIHLFTGSYTNYSDLSVTHEWLPRRTDIMCVKSLYPKVCAVKGLNKN